MIEILSDIVSQIGGFLYSSLNDVPRLIEELKDSLYRKRYLIVIDDI